MSELDQLLDRRLNGKKELTLQYRLTARVSPDRHCKIVKLAERFGITKTALFEEVVSAAIQDFFTSYADSLELHERADLYEEMTDQEEEEAREIISGLSSGLSPAECYELMGDEADKEVAA